MDERWLRRQVVVLSRLVAILIFDRERVRLARRLPPVARMSGATVAGRALSRRFLFFALT